MSPVVGWGTRTIQEVTQAGAGRRLPGHAAWSGGQQGPDLGLASRRVDHEGLVAPAGTGDEQVEVVVGGDGHT